MGGENEWCLVLLAYTGVEIHTGMLLLFNYIYVRTTCTDITLSFTLINQQAISGSCRSLTNGSIVYTRPVSNQTVSGSIGPRFTLMQFLGLDS